jgi:hypothetical protein
MIAASNNVAKCKYGADGSRRSSSYYFGIFHEKLSRNTKTLNEDGQYRTGLKARPVEACRFKHCIETLRLSLQIETSIRVRIILTLKA